MVRLLTSCQESLILKSGMIGVPDSQIARNVERDDSGFERAQTTGLAGIGVDALDAGQSERIGIEIGVRANAAPEHPVAVKPQLRFVKQGRTEDMKFRRAPRFER